MGGRLQYCALMALSTPLWGAVAAKLAGRMLINPARYFRKVDRRGMTFPDPLPDMEHIHVDSAGVRIHAATHGIGSGKPLVLFIHGFPETWACWRHQIKEFAGDYEIAAIDMRGYGDSDVPKGAKQYTIDKLCADVAAVITAVGHTKATLVAHDWGGSLAWHMPVLYPQMVEKLVIMNSPHPAAYKDPTRFNGDQFKRSWYFLLFQARGLPEAYLRHGDFRELSKMFLTAPAGTCTPGAMTAADVERYKAAFAKPGSLTAAINYYRASVATGTKWKVPVADKVFHSMITVPTMIMYADKDNWMLPQMHKGNEKSVSNLTTVCIEDCSHWSQQDKPEAVNSHIRAFLTGKVAEVAEVASKATPRPGSRGSSRGSMIMLKAAPAVSGSNTPRQVLKQQ